MNRTRVLVVDDSPTMRGLVSAALRSDPEIDVVGSARDPLEARQAIKALNPDVVTLDVEMPNMDGIAFLEKIMRLRPMPVIMISTLTQRGAEITLKALEMGAFDCVAKPSSGISPAAAFADLPEKVKAAGKTQLRAASAKSARPAGVREFRPSGRMVAIGSSTGGVEALLTIVQRFPANCPPTVITQHMPATFTASFAERLNRSSQARVAEARDGAPLEEGQVYLAPGGFHHLEVTNGMRCRLRDDGPVNGHRPSVDVLFNSVARVAGSKSLGVILTGMGRDGARGLRAMRDAGAATLGQDEASSVVYGMPKAALEIEAVEQQLPLERIAERILDLCGAEERVRYA